MHSFVVKAAVVACVLLIAGMEGSLAQTNPRPTTSFVQMKGRLAVPARGPRVLRFGERTQAGDISRGVTIATSSGARVIAPGDGLVVFAGEFRDFGKLVIISAGNGYHLLLGGLGQLDVQNGQRVSAGDPVGTMPLAQTAMLYLEIRKNQMPLDPAPWLRG